QRHRCHRRQPDFVAQARRIDPALDRLAAAGPGRDIWRRQRDIGAGSSLQRGFGPPGRFRGCCRAIVAFRGRGMRKTKSRRVERGKKDYIRAMFRYANPAIFMRLSGLLLPWVSALAAIALVAGLVMSFRVPPDYQQGMTVTIMFVHVPAAIVA